MFKVNRKLKVRKILYNGLFLLYSVLSLSLLIVGIVYIWSKLNVFIDGKYVASRILKETNYYMYFSLVVSIIGFLLNMFWFNGEVTKIIDKEYYNKVAIIQSILFIIGLILLLFTPMFLKGANLALDDYKTKSLYCLGYCTSFMCTFFFFYIFSFLDVISEDECYNVARPYYYRINKLNYNDICKLISKKLEKGFLKGEFFNSNYKLDYYVCHGEYEYVYAFANMKNISDEFFRLYSGERLIDFVEYLYSKVLDKKKNVKIMYFICVDEYNENFKDLIQLSIYQDEHFSVVHTLINFKTNDLYIGGVRDDEKNNVQDYISLKEEIDKILVDIIERR